MMKTESIKYINIYWISMEKTYKYRLYPSNKQINIFNNILNNCRYLYNSMLEYEKYIYEKDIRFANKIELNNLLPDIKIINPNLKSVHSQILQNVNDKVIKSFNGFFNRINKGNIKTLTIIRTSTNKWFACFSVHIDINPPKRESNKIIGLDLGLDKFA